MKKIFFLVIFITLSFFGHTQQQTIYLDQRLLPVEKQAIYEMAELLRRSTGNSIPFDSLHKYQGQGIYITTTEKDYYKKMPSGLKQMGAEGMYIESDKRYIYITANSTLGMREAIFVYLEQLGFRFYFPNAAWHIIPQNKTVFTKYKKLIHPDFAYRTIGMGYGEGSAKLSSEYAFWKRANRMGGAFQVNTGHSHGDMFINNKVEFQKHPEYLSKPLINGNLQPGTVFNYASDGLAQVAYDWTARVLDGYAAQGNPLQMWSMEPFDGNTFCNLPACQKIGANASDQVFYFANAVARKLKKTHPDKWIGMLAYNDHIDIPKYELEDNIFVSITNGFNRSSFTTEELIKRWSGKLKILGVYDYMSVYAWNRDMPGKSLAGNYRKVYKNINNYYKNNVRVYQAESTYGWIAKGLGHYMAAKLTWDTKTDVQKTVQEFYALSFPQTRKWMAPLFESWLNNQNAFPDDEDLYNWFSLFKSALENCNEQNEMQRLNQVGLYLYYVKQMQELLTSTPEKIKETQINICAYLWEIFETGVTDSYAALNELPASYGPEYSIANHNAVWKKRTVNYPRTKKDWLNYTSNILPGFKTTSDVKSFSRTTRLPNPEIRNVDRKVQFVNLKKTIGVAINALMYVDLAASDSFFLRMQVGNINKPGKAILKIYAWNESLEPTGDPVREFVIQPDMNWETINFKDLPRKRYIFHYTDDYNGALIYFPGKLKFLVLASKENKFLSNGYNDLYFYVPKGVRKFYIKKESFMRLTGPGVKTRDYSDKENLVEVQVDEKKTGWWLMDFSLGNFFFIGIPPLFSLTPDSYFFL